MTLWSFYFCSPHGCWLGYPEASRNTAALFGFPGFVQVPLRQNPPAVKPFARDEDVRDRSPLEKTKQTQPQTSTSPVERTHRIVTNYQKRPTPPLVLVLFLNSRGKGESYKVSDKILATFKEERHWLQISHTQGCGEILQNSDLLPRSSQSFLFR